MAAYVIVTIEVTDPEKYAKYMELSPIAIEKNGGRLIVRGGEKAALEGDWNPSRMVVVEFPSLEQAKRFYDSPEYREARQARSGAANMNILAVEGV